MTNGEKEKIIRPWIYHEERVTAHFIDAPDLNAEVLGCTDQSVDLSIETHMPSLKQHISVALSQLEVTESLSYYTRDPEQPLKHRRLMLVIKNLRPSVTS